MPRSARKQSESGLYHVMARGISRQTLFEEDGDYGRYLALLGRAAPKAAVEIHAYCLMSNHVHLLLRGAIRDVSAAIAEVDGAYARYFNWKYDREGPLFQGRFRSEAVEDDAHYLSVLRYIVQNPEKAGLAAAPTYPWSSYEANVGGRGACGVAVASAFAVDLCGGSGPLRRFLQEGDSRTHLDIPSVNVKSDAALSAFMEEECGVKPLDVAGLPRPERDAVLATCKSAGFTAQRIGRVTGIGRGIVQRA